MRARIEPGCFSRTVRVPASKSHTIRRLLVAALAGGVSRVEYPLDSLDARSCVSVCRSLGAVIDEERAADSRCPNPADERGARLMRWTVRGAPPARRDGGAAGRLYADVGNSGTTLYLCMAAAALGSAAVEFSGDSQIRRRSAAPLLEALTGLGVRAESAHGDGCAPLVVQGPWKGGRVRLPCPTSQYLSALLLAAPLAPERVVTEIDVPLLNEKPYIEMTLSYLDAQGITWESAPDFSFFRIRGGAAYKPIDGPVPGDFSSAAFPACAAAVSGGTLTILGLDPGDTQGDKAFFEILARMGTEVHWTHDADGEWRVRVSGREPLRGGEFDLNAAPDMLPALAVLAACAEGDTAIVNVAHARLKETDRIAVMARELGHLGVACTERPDGLVVHGGVRPRGGTVDSHGDHRVAMAFAALAAGASGPVEIEGAECAAVTYPGFLDLFST